ncbi:MAG TPA: glycosyltransferase family 4 protein [Candidatus Limnocylindrales bacterium]
MATNGRWLYLDTYTVLEPRRGVPWSDAIGYGVTASSAIRRELRRKGIEVIVPRVDLSGIDPASGMARTTWANRLYAQVAFHVRRYRPDVIFIFHIFVVFPTVVRKTLQDLGVSIPVVGYTHGSHWDSTDLHRFDLYSGLELADLANMHVLDRLFLVSGYMRATLQDAIGGFNAAVADDIMSRSRVVGLPLDTELIDSSRVNGDGGHPTIVFNHAPSAGKNPDLFAKVAGRILGEREARVLFTRRFEAGSPGAATISALARRFGDRVVLGNDMSLVDYYRALWRSDIQVSTASHESLGMATLEAMYTNNCCLLPRLGAYPEVCQDDPQVLYDVDEDELVERLHHVLDHPAERRHTAKRLAALAAQHSPQRVVDRIVDGVVEL